MRGDALCKGSRFLATSNISSVISRVCGPHRSGLLELVFNKRVRDSLSQQAWVDDIWHQSAHG